MLCSCVVLARPVQPYPAVTDVIGEIGALMLEKGQPGWRAELDGVLDDLSTIYGLDSYRAAEALVYTSSGL